jgi:anti-anti-sigma regulatory factor
MSVVAEEAVTMIALRAEVLNETALHDALLILEEPGSPILHLDLAAVRVPTAEGLGTLVMLNRELRARGGGLALVNVPALSYEVFEVTGLVGVLDVRSVRPASARGVA